VRGEQFLVGVYVRFQSAFLQNMPSGRGEGNRRGGIKQFHRPVFGGDLQSPEGFRKPLDRRFKPGEATVGVIGQGDKGAEKTEEVFPVDRDCDVIHDLDRKREPYEDAMRGYLPSWQVSAHGLTDGRAAPCVHDAVNKR
jgi:hypothetical protein